MNDWQMIDRAGRWIDNPHCQAAHGASYLLKWVSVHEMERINKPPMTAWWWMNVLGECLSKSSLPSGRRPWQYSPQHSGNQERDQRLWGAHGCEWPQGHHVLVRQRQHPVPQAAEQPRGLRARAGQTRGARQGAHPQACLTTQSEDPWLNWRELHRQVVPNVFPHHIFSF